jgi:hypothetical protein
MVVAACGGQIAPGGAYHDCNVGNPYECCEYGTNGGLSCPQYYAPAACGQSGWTCPSGGFPAAACVTLCGLVVERDAETDATTIGDDEIDDEIDGEADGGCDLGYTPECCGFGAPSGGYSCEFDFGVSVCGANGWTCPNGGNMAPACSGICMDYPDAEGDASAPGDATDGKE